MARRRGRSMAAGFLRMLAIAAMAAHLLSCGSPAEAGEQVNDTSAPTTNISFPAGSTYGSTNWSGSISGSTTDTAPQGATISGLKIIQLSIRQVNGNYYDPGAK